MNKFQQELCKNNKFQQELCKNKLITKKDVQAAVIQMYEPLKPFYSEEKAGLYIGSTGCSYSEAIAGMEGFSRILWGLTPLTAGGRDYDLWDIYLKGIKSGTDPLNKEYWGKIGDGDQRMVEMAAISLALILTPEKLWNPLTPKEKDNLYNWLDQINHFFVHECNWKYFNIMVNTAFMKIGRPYSADRLESCFDRLEDFYLDNSWYSDGINEQRDYYISFAIHYYNLIYAKVMEKEDPIRSKLFKERASAFAKDFIYWFSPDGSAVPFGRSMAYRFAQAAFWSALAYAEVPVFTTGVVKGIILRHLRWWFNKPIFSSDGILTIGFAYPSLTMAECYNSPCSPYWAMKTFLPLALPDEHPFWQVKEEPLPVLQETSVQQEPHMVLSRKDNSIFAFSAGQYCSNKWFNNVSAKYSKFVYSNIFGFSVSKSDFDLALGAYDSMLAVSEGDNSYRVRYKCEEFSISEEVVYSKWIPMKEVEIKTWLIPGNPWHIRIHRIDTKRYIETAEGGFAISREMDKQLPDNNGIIKDKSGAVLKLPWGTSGIIDLLGKRTPEIINAEPNTNLLYPRTFIPVLKSCHEPGVHWSVCAVLGDEKTLNGEWEKQPKANIANGEIKVKNSMGMEIFSLDMR